MQTVLMLPGRHGKNSHKLSIGGELSGVYTIAAAISIDDDITLQGGPDVFIFQSWSLLFPRTKVTLSAGGAKERHLIAGIAIQVGAVHGGHCARRTLTSSLARLG
jgi:hypothetical protein